MSLDSFLFQIVQQMLASISLNLQHTSAMSRSSYLMLQNQDTGSVWERSLHLTHTIKYLQQTKHVCQMENNLFYSAPPMDMVNGSISIGKIVGGWVVC